MHDAQAGGLGERLEERGVAVHVHGGIVYGRAAPPQAVLVMVSSSGVGELSRGGEMLSTMKHVFPGYDSMRLNLQANATAARHPPDSLPMAPGAKPTGVPRVPA
jgi:hypothetical protein